MARNRIDLKPYNDNYEERLASGVIIPGMLLERDSDNKYKAHSVALGAAEKLFAREDDKQGKTIDDSYAIGKRVSAFFCISGDEVNAIFTTGIAVAIGDKLESAGDGRLQLFTSGVVIAVGDEAIGSAVANAHYSVKIL